MIDVPWPLRRLIVSLILRKRPEQTAEAYRSIWWEEGSPLTVISERLQQKMAETWDAPVELAMRYGEPSIGGVLKNLAQRGITQAVLAPLYPQFAMSTVTTVVEEARQAIKKNHLSMELEVVPCFYDQPEYITALAASARPGLSKAMTIYC